ncbi:MAG: hypothetical protein JZU60_04575, partial [Ilumatobacteraceae bacterium]|nr:hypothetical protein [Ilumatobacteraceae bacterium]
ATVESLTLALGSTATVTLDAQMTDATITSGAADITLSAVGQDVDGAANGVLTVRSTVANVANSIIKGDNATGDTLVIIDQVVAPLDLGAYADLQGVESLTLALGSTATVTLDAQMTSVTVTSGAADITLSAAGQNVTSTAAASDTVRTGLLATVSGNLALGAGGTDVLIISNTANISTATTTEVEEIHLAINVGATMTVAQDDKISSANATGNNTVTLTDVATAAHQLSAGVETYVLAAGANSVTSGVASQTINADALTDAQVLTLAGTHNVTVTLVAGDLTSTSSGNLTVTATTGSNVITTGIGADTITGGAGVDNMNGGDGADVFIIAAAADHAAGETILGGLLTDVIRFTSTAAGTLTLDANVTVEEARITDAAGVATGVTAENINATNAVGTIALYGNDGNNQLTGNG